MRENQVFLRFGQSGTANAIMWLPNPLSKSSIESENNEHDQIRDPRLRCHLYDRA